MFILFAMYVWGAWACAVGHSINEAERQDQPKVERVKDKGCLKDGVWSTS